MFTSMLSSVSEVSQAALEMLKASAKDMPVQCGSFEIV